MSKLYLMSFRAVVTCEDDVEAAMVADVIKTEGEKHLDAEDGDDLYVAQVIPFGAYAEPAELVDRLLRTRNDLIKTRYIECWNLAKQLDMQIFAMQKQLDPQIVETYNHGRFIEVATAILERGEYPL